MSKTAQSAGVSSGSDSARLQKLARGIEALAEKDERLLDLTHEMGEARREAAGELYSACAQFVDSLNNLLDKVEMVLDPPRDLMAFRETGANLIQINARGRILEIEYSATEELLSTEEFRVPYTVSGTVRAFNQELLDRNIMEEHTVFYTVEGPRRMWRFFDSRTHRSGPVDQDYLISMMELLV